MQVVGVRRVRWEQMVCGEKVGGGHLATGVLRSAAALPSGTRGTSASSQLRPWGWAGVGSSYSDRPGSWSLGGVS